MTPERHEEADREGKLTAEEMAEGWRFCMCEWDGLLLKAGDFEATFCGCWFDKEGNLLPPENKA